LDAASLPLPLDSKPLKNVSIDNLGVTGTLALNYTYKGSVQNQQVIIVSRIDGTDSKCIATSLIGSIRVEISKIETFCSKRG
jgi:hypothetical protein